MKMNEKIYEACKKNGVYWNYIHKISERKWAYSPVCQNTFIEEIEMRAEVIGSGQYLLDAIESGCFSQQGSQ